MKCPICNGDMLGGMICHYNPDCPIHDEPVPVEIMELLDKTKKQLDRAKWWLNEIVESHRFTPISTAEMALKEINNINKINTLDDRMIGCETLDIPESYKELHKAVESANVKLAGKYDIVVDALLRIKQQKMRLIDNEERVGLLLDVFNIAEQAIEKIKEKE